jgi:hypothetical protein
MHQSIQAHSTLLFNILEVLGVSSNQSSDNASPRGDEEELVAVVVVDDAKATTRRRREEGAVCRLVLPSMRAPTARYERGREEDFMVARQTGGLFRSRMRIEKLKRALFSLEKKIITEEELSFLHFVDFFFFGKKKADDVGKERKNKKKHALASP